MGGRGGTGGRGGPLAERRWRGCSGAEDHAAGADAGRGSARRLAELPWRGVLALGVGGTRGGRHGEHDWRDDEGAALHGFLRKSPFTGSTSSASTGPTS